MGKKKSNTKNSNAMDVENSQEMSIEQVQPITMRTNNIHRQIPKKKKIFKNKIISTNNQSLKSKVNIMKNVKNEINSKKKKKSLQEKQEIFKKVVKGLNLGEGKVSKKYRKKRKILLKKELRKYLQQNVIQQSRLEKNTQIIGFKKNNSKHYNESKQVIQFKSLMGCNLSTLKNMIKQNNIH